MGHEPADWSDATTFEEYVIKVTAENILRKKQDLPPTQDYIILLETYPGKGRIMEIWKKFQESKKQKP